jgi:hypothetical protein
MLVRVLPIAFAFLLLAAPRAGQLAEDAARAEGEKFFETKVRPLLVARCYKCHHGDKAKGKLRLDSLAAMLAGGESGAAIVPGKPAESLLVEAINYESFEMPPDGQLPAEQIAVLTEWVKLGAPWPGIDASSAKPTGPREKFTAEDRAWWAFQPLSSAPPPALDDAWQRNEIDRFVLQRLENARIAPAAEASRETLIRRVYFDLIGLPPTPAEVAAFVAADSPNGYEQLVDRLLADPRYGERQARPWLDLVRYAESDGFRQDAFRPDAWRYRDWVIRALNADMPYDQFVTAQLAGDELAAVDPEAVVATGFLRLGIYEYNQRDARTQRQDMLNDITDTTADAFLGLGFGCAKCHDHKFDPILQADYFRLQAFFAPMIFENNAPVATAGELAEYQRQLAEWEEKTADIRRQIDQIEAPHRERLGKSAVVKFPEDVQAIYNKPVSERNSHEEQLVDLVHRQVLIEQEQAATKLKEEKKEKWEALQKQLAAFDKLKPRPPTRVPGVRDFAGEIAVTHVPHKRKPIPVEPGFLTLLDPAPAEIAPPPMSTGGSSQSTGRRLALARWITRPDNPLATRVIVNRLWRHHFGRGLVATPSDFGRLGQPPSHPELLDWLARRLVAENWSLKSMHRLMVTSATYRQSSVRETPEVARSVDPSCRLLWRMPVRRLEAEAIRDAMLAVSGDLDPRQGGASVDARQPRRTIYVKAIRNTRDPLLDAFDLPEGVASTADRNTTTSPVQSLLMINGDWTLARAKSLAGRLTSARLGSQEKTVDLAYQMALGRDPSGAERSLAIDFLRGAKSLAEPAMPAEQWVKVFPGRKGTAVDIRAKTPHRLRVPATDKLPDGDFTVEAFVLLRSMFEDASVRTIASHWDSNTGQPGWALGVTSKKSRYTPRNLILQLVGDPGQGGAGYEVIPSGLHLELGQPYYVAVSVKLQDKSPAGVTFYLKPLRGSGELQTAQVAHQVIAHYRSPQALVLGGRDQGDARHRWDGLLDDVRITAAALPADKLLIAADSAQSPEGLVGFWRFEKQLGVLVSTTGDALAIQPPGLDEAASPDRAALVDFCHVLLNSNEFLYVD